MHRILPCGAALAVAFTLALSLATAGAGELQRARISQVVKDVKLLPGQAAPRPASVSDEVRDNTAVRTGVESRAELTFTDATLARLGANTIFSFNEGTRNLELGGGAMLLRVPKNAGGAKINTAAITAAITGTTIMLEYHPDAYIKFIVLEGTGRIYRPDHVGDSVLVHAGQMLIVNPKGTTLPDPVDVDLNRLVKTSVLINGFPPLASLALIMQEIGAQSAEKSFGNLVDTNLVIFGGGTAVTLLDPTQSNSVDQANSNSARQSLLAPTVTPTPTPLPPSKFGPLSTITAPNPYVISSGTTISTDPTVTTAGQTDFGKIYRGPSLDGTPSNYFFGSTTNFDTSSEFNTFFSAADFLPIALFKFQGLQLAGNPTISIAGNGPTELGLISLGDITSGTAPATLTFTGIDLLFLASENGSITLGSNLTFENIPLLFLYARGTNSSLNFDAAITGSKSLALFSQGDIRFNNPFALTETGAASVAPDITTNLSAAGDLIASNGLSVTLDNSGNDLPGIAASVLGVDGNLTIGGPTGLSLTIANQGGHLGPVASIRARVNGDLTANVLNGLIDNRNASTIDGTAVMTFAVGGAIAVQNDVDLIIANGNEDGNGNGTIRGPATLSLSGGSISIGGNLNADVANNAGGSMLAGARLSFGASGDISVGGQTTLFLDNSPFNNFGVFVGEGSITGSAVISFFAHNFSSTDLVDTFLFNDGGGQISGDASILGQISGNLTSQNHMFFDVQNSGDTNGSTLLPGGTIGGDALVDLKVLGNIEASSFAEFSVLNNDNRFLATGGTILGNATVVLVAASISTGDFFNLLVNDTNGTLGGTAQLIASIPGSLQIGTEGFIHIINGGGNIGGDALIDFAGGAVSAANFLTVSILNQSGTIAGNAGLDFNLSGALTSQSLSVLIDNAGGTIGNGGNILVTTGGDLVTTTGDATFNILNTDDGTINNGANITLTVGGAISILGQLNLLIGNYDETANPAGQIGGAGNISVTTGGDLTADSISAYFQNRGGGIIGSSASLIINIGGALTTLHDRPDALGLSTSLSLVIETRCDNFFGNTQGSLIGGDATLSLQADSASIGGILVALLGNVGSTIDGNALLHFGVTHDLTAGSSDWEILNNGIPINPTSTVHGNATIDVSAANFTAGSLFAFIANRSGGVIDSDASIDFAIGGNLTSPGDVTFDILNNQQPGIGTGGGSIGGNATSNLTATNFSTGGTCNIQILNDNGSIGGDATITLATASLTTGPLTATIDNTLGTIGGNSSVSFTITNALDVTGDATFHILRNSGETIGTITIDAGSINVTGSLTAGLLEGISRVSSGDVSVSSTGAIVVGQDFLVDGTISAGTNITVSGTLTTTGVATAGDFITAGSVKAMEISAGTDITVTQLGGGQPGVFVNTITAGGNINLMNVAQVQSFSFSSDGSINFTPDPFALTAAAIVSTGPTFPALASNGFDANPSLGNNNPGNGGQVTVTLASLTIGSVNDLTSITANGGAFAIASTAGGNGGTVSIKATGAVTLNDGNITASSGTIPFGGPAPLGNGGTVNITTTGAITVNSAVEVSSNDTDNNPGRISATGGNISLTSTETTAGPAITVGNTGQLLAFLDTAAPGPGGTIALLATGNGGSSVNFNGFAEADRGTIDIRHTGINGTVNLGDASGSNFVQLFADVVKVGALGSNGVLTVGAGLLSADTTLKLYAPTSSGTIDFVANVSLSSGVSTILAAGTITIQPRVVVNIAGNGGPAQVFTNNPNYSGFGGNNRRNGTFGGLGANNPLPLVNAPPFGPTMITRSTTSAATPAPIPTRTTALARQGDGRSVALPPRGRPHAPIIRVQDSNELLALADRAASGSPIMGQSRSNTRPSRNPRGPEGLLAGNGRVLHPTPDGVRDDLMLRRSEGRSRALPP